MLLETWYPKLEKINHSQVSLKNIVYFSIGSDSSKFYVQIFIAVLNLLVKTWKQCKHLRIGEMVG